MTLLASQVVCKCKLAACQLQNLLYLMIFKNHSKKGKVMFLCWENGIGFCWRFALYLEVFQPPSLQAASCSWSRQVASHFDFLF